MGEYRNIFLDFNVPAGSDFDPRTLHARRPHGHLQLPNGPGNPADHRRFRRASCSPASTRSQYRYTVNSNAANVNAATPKPRSAPSSSSATFRCFSSSPSIRTISRSARSRHASARSRPHQRRSLPQRRQRTAVHRGRPGARRVRRCRCRPAQGDLSRPQGRRTPAPAPSTSTSSRTRSRPSAISIRRRCPAAAAARARCPPPSSATWKGSILSRPRQHRHSRARHHQTADSVSAGGSGDPALLEEGRSAHRAARRPARPAAGRPGAAVTSIEVVRRRRRPRRRAHRRAAALHDRRRLERRRSRGRGPSTYPGTMPIFYHRCAHRGGGCAPARTRRAPTP